MSGDSELEKLYNLIVAANEKQTIILKEEIHKEVAEVKSEIADLKRSIEEEKSKINKLEKAHTELQGRYEALSKSLKKNNIIIFGVQYNVKPTSYADDIIHKLNSWLKLELTVNCLNNAYPIGKPGSSQPILVQFLSYLTKANVLKECKKLKGTGISISEDLTKEDREKLKILIKHKKLAQNKGYKAVIRRNKLFINDDEYTPNKLQDIANNDQPGTSEGNIQMQERKIISAPSTPTTQSIVDIESDGEYTDIETNSVNNLDTCQDELTNEAVVKKRKTTALYADEMKKLKFPIGQKIHTKTRKIITRSVNQ